MFSSTHRSSLFGSFVVGFALVGAGGCKETVSSKNIRTAGIAMETHVTGLSLTSSKVEVTLRVGGDESNTYVILEDGDELIALADDEDKTMEKVSDGIYEASFGTAAEGIEFQVKLMRDDDDDAPSNIGTMPAPFMITSDLGDDPISREDDLEITWEESGSDDDMKLEVEDDTGPGCIFTDTFDIPGDSGAYTIEGGEDGLDGTSGNDETCDIVLSLSRNREGTIDGHLDRESKFELKQVRSTTATSAP